MENKEVILYLSDEVKEYLNENEIDIKTYLWENNIDANLDYRYFRNENDTSAKKDLLPVIILASGVSIFLVVGAINNLMGTILRRPQIVQIEECETTTIDGTTTKKCNKKYELLEPKNVNNETKISLDAIKIASIEYRSKGK